MKTYTLKIRDNKISEHFYLDEFIHHATGNEMYLDPEFISVFIPTLEEFRAWYNRPINVNSCYRPAAYNKKVGGSSNSRHLVSCAIDFNLPAEYKKYGQARKNEFLANIKNKWVQICHAHGRYAQVNFYDDRLHLGIAKGKDSFLDYRTK